MPLVLWREQLLPVLRECCGPAAERVLSHALKRTGVSDARMSPAHLLRLVRGIEMTLPADRANSRFIQRLRKCASGEIRPAGEALYGWFPTAFAYIVETVGPAAESLVRRTRETMDHQQPLETVGGLLAFLEQLRRNLPAEINADTLIADIKGNVFACAARPGMSGSAEAGMVRLSAAPATGYRHGY